ncbi:MAG: hypothetical protein H7833_02600 [Magnetococcus sp. DMHC-1]|nr:hypothetical protein [Magnetococcales bacterium]
MIRRFKPVVLVAFFLVTSPVPVLAEDYTQILADEQAARPVVSPLVQVMPTLAYYPVYVPVYAPVTTWYPVSPMALK